MIVIDSNALNGLTDIIFIFTLGILLGIFLSSVICIINFLINFIYSFFKN